MLGMAMWSLWAGPINVVAHCTLHTNCMHAARACMQCSPEVRWGFMARLVNLGSSGRVCILNCTASDSNYF
jgi:hypothetical protein